MRAKIKTAAPQRAVPYRDYRIPMPIAELYIYRNGSGSYVCPRCRITLEREFTSYCDRCGQCLSWSAYRKAKHIYIR